MKIYLIFALFSLFVTTFGLEVEGDKNEGFDNHIFNSGSKFMKGFETGILARSKKLNPASFGCKP